MHGDLEEEIFMELPPGFHQEEGGRVCRLKKALYGLKQSPRAWFGWFSKAMLSMGYHQSRGDHTFFIKHHGDLMTALLVYVDDIVVTGNDITEQVILKQNLAKEFEIKELGVLKYFLGIEVAYSKDGIFLSQRKYIMDLLIETGLLGGKGSSIPVDPNLKLQANTKGEVIDKGRFQRLVDRLIYLSHTRPDIAFAVSLVS